MGKAFAQILGYFDHSIVFRIFTTDGIIHETFESLSFKGADKLAKAWGCRKGYEIEWKIGLKRTDADVMQFEQAYEEYHDIKMNGREKKSFMPWS